MLHFDISEVAHLSAKALLPCFIRALLPSSCQYNLFIRCYGGNFDSSKDFLTANFMSRKLKAFYKARSVTPSAFSRTFSRVKITHNQRLTTAHDFLKAVETPVDVFEELGVRRYIKIYAMGVKPRYRHRGVMKEMLKAAMEVCKSAFLPAIAAVFCTARSQQIAQELGFEKHNEIYYVRYLINDEVVFADTGKGNHGAVLMALRIPGVVEPEPERKEAAPRFQIAGDQN